MEYKVCSRCRKELPISFFRKAKKYKDGLRCECEVCQRIYNKTIKYNKCAGCGAIVSSTNARGMCDDCVEIYDNAIVIPKITAKEGYYICRTCKRELPNSMFGPNKYNARGRNYQCKDCARNYGRNRKILRKMTQQQTNQDLKSSKFQTITITPFQERIKGLSAISREVLHWVEGRITHSGLKATRTRLFFALEDKFEESDIFDAINNELKLNTEHIKWNDKCSADSFTLKPISPNTYEITSIKDAMQVFMMDCVHRVYGIKLISTKNLLAIINNYIKCKGINISLASEFELSYILNKYNYKRRFYGKTECVEMAFDPLLLSLQPPIKRECDEQDTSKQDNVSIEVCNLTQDELDFLLTPLK